jgi:hypothetical protein
MQKGARLASLAPFPPIEISVPATEISRIMPRDGHAQGADQE